MSAAPASGLHSQGRCLTSIISILEREHEGGFGHSSPSRKTATVPPDANSEAEARQRRGERVLHQIHFNCTMTVPSEIIGRLTPVLLAFLAIHSRATRVLSSAPALSW